MKNRILATVVLAVCMAVPFGIAGPTSAVAEEVQRQISVSGEGQVAAAPDMATIILGVTHEAKEAGDAMAMTTQATARMLDRLGNLGVEPRDMQTSSLSLNPVWSNRGASSSGVATITGFVASNAVAVRLRDLADLGRVLDAVIADGANDFKGLRFSVQEPEPLMNEARQKAVADAIAKAQLLTGAAGVTLGRVLSMIEHGGGQPMMMEMAAARSGGGVPIAEGEVTIQASVSMVFAITD